MSEQGKHRHVEAVPETVENSIAEAVENEAVEDVKAEAEKAPAEVRAPKKNRKKTAKRRKKKNGVPVQVAALLLVITLLFGMVVGFAMGRRTGNLRAKDAEGRINELQDLLVDEGSMELDVFTDELSEENEEALGDLSGEGLESEEVDSVLTALQGEDGFGVEEEDKTAAEDEVVAEFKDGTLMSSEVQAQYEEQALDYIFAGYSEEEIAEDLIKEVMTDLVMEKVLAQHAQEMGVYELSTEDYKQIETEAEASFNEQVEFYKLLVEETDLTDEELTRQAQELLLETDGVDYDTVKADLEAGWWAQKLFDEVTKDMEVDSEKIGAVYEEQLAVQKENYETYPEDYEMARMNGETVLYNLPGYREVQILMLDFDSTETGDLAEQLAEQMEALDPEKDAEVLAELQAQLDECYASAEAKAQEALKELEGGADFESMIVKYGGETEDSVYARGCAISADSAMWQEEIVESAMALEKIGDVSGIIRLGEGVCVLKYKADMQEGAVALDDVYDAIAAEALEEAKYTAYEEQVNQWMEAAAPVYYPERML